MEENNDSSQSREQEVDPQYEAQKENMENGKEEPPRKKIKSKKIGILNGDGLSCHQCKSRKEKELLCSCHNHFYKKMTQSLRQCHKKYCFTCMSRYYNENYVVAPDNFNCPSCRQMCSCASCLRRPEKIPVAAPNFVPWASQVSSNSNFLPSHPSSYDSFSQSVYIPPRQLHAPPVSVNYDKPFLVQNNAGPRAVQAPPVSVNYERPFIVQNSVGPFSYSFEPTGNNMVNPLNSQSTISHNKFLQISQNGAFSQVIPSIETMHIASPQIQTPSGLTPKQDYSSYQVSPLESPSPSADSDGNSALSNYVASSNQVPHFSKNPAASPFNSRSPWLNLSKNTPPSNVAHLSKASGISPSLSMVNFRHPSISTAGPAIVSPHINSGKSLNGHFISGNNTPTSSVPSTPNIGMPVFHARPSTSSISSSGTPTIMGNNASMGWPSFRNASSSGFTAPTHKKSSSSITNFLDSVMEVAATDMSVRK